MVNQTIVMEGWWSSVGFLEDTLEGAAGLAQDHQMKLMWALVAVIVVVAIDLRLRSTMKSRHLVKGAKKKKTESDVIPYEDPLLATGAFVFNVFTGQTYKVRHPEYLCERNMASEESNGGSLCRQTVFAGIPIIVSWDPDHYRSLTAHNEDYGKMTGFIKKFDDISKRSILVVEGEEWKDQKRLIHPAFQFSHIKNQVPKFNLVAQRLMDGLSRTEGPVEMMPWMSKATLDGLSLAGFGLDMGALLDKNTEAYEVYTDTMTMFENPMALLPFYDSLPLETNRKWKEAVKTYIKYLTDLVGEKRLQLIEEQRKGEEREGKDILDVLIAAKDEDENVGLTDEELIHNVNIFFIAGHETSSSTMSFAAHMLAEHPDIQEQIYQEIQQVVGDRDPSHEDFPNLKHTANFLKEVMRLYPAAPGVARVTRKDVEFGNYHVTEGSMVMLSSYTMHRHSSFWERPMEFWPDRFRPENSRGRHPFAYTPFAAGPRACLGKQFALLEMKILLIHLLKNFRIGRNPNPEVEFKEDVGLVLRPRIGATVILEKRE